MLTPQQKAEAEKRLKLMASEMEFEKKVKETIRNNNKAINDLIASLKDDPKAQRNLLIQIVNSLGPKILAMEKLSRGFEATQQKMKSDKDRMNKERLFSLEDKQRLGLSVKEIQQTIKKIQQTVKSSVEQEAKKRQKIEDDMEKSLGEIQEKITLFNKESEEMEKENQTLQGRKKEIEEKMQSLDADFKKKAEEKDEQVRKQKQDLMVRLQSLQGQVSQITEINKEFSTKQKGNFDKKLSLYLKTKKFPDYSTSFQNSAKTIDQCKEELLKGVQRMNDAKEMVEKFDKESKEWSNQYLVELKKKVENEQRVEACKKEKEVVRERIIALQTKMKEKKAQQQANAAE